MRTTIATIVLLLVATACQRNEPATSAASATATAHATAQSATASTTVGGVTLQTSTVAIADLNDTVAARYGIDRSQDGVLLLVTVRDASGNGVDPGDLQLTATASALPDPAAPLELRSIQTGDMTDYIGVLRAAPPATAQFKFIATRNGSRADIATTAELLPR